MHFICYTPRTITIVQVVSGTFTVSIEPASMNSSKCRIWHAKLFQVFSLKAHGKFNQFITFRLTRLYLLAVAPVFGSDRSRSKLAISTQAILIFEKGWFHPLNIIHLLLGFLIDVGATLPLFAG
jgi:hypothetical protein